MDADNSGSHFVHRGFEVVKDELESRLSPVLLDLIQENCCESAADVFNNDDVVVSQHGYVSSCGSSHLSRSNMLVPPLVSLPPLQSSSTQHQQDSISAELTSGVIMIVIIATNIV